MTFRIFTALLVTVFFLPRPASSQNIEKISFDPKDSASGYYLAVQPQSKVVKGVFVLLTSFIPPEGLLPETKLQNVAYANDILTIVAFMKLKLYADSSAIRRLTVMLADVVTRFGADSSKFVLGGYEESGNIALRYTELSYEHPARFPVQPKAVLGIDSPVDLIGLWHWSENQIKKNYYAGAVGDAKFYLDNMTKETGTIYNNRQRFEQLTPFNKEDTAAGNEKYLRSVPVRLYYDTDINWQLKNRRNSFYDTKMPDGSELINRLLLSGNDNAEFVSSKLPGLRSNGIRHPSSLSIVDEVECIQWIKKCLNIVDFNTWTPPYQLAVPNGWTIERFPLPPDFASQFSYMGIEDLRFAPGWADFTREDYWSYAYLWWLDGNPLINASELQKNLQAYYTGLVARNIISRKIPDNKLVPLTVTVVKAKTSANDIETYSGVIRMLDYMTQKPIVLRHFIHVKDKGPQTRSMIFIEVSPRPLEHPVWQQLDKIEKGFIAP